ncbi:hypothetical protein SBA7_1230014 [Candidatus Sulfotelmatobacter sp. SbA7]|nr:hypothetical protein SBA7_1230014 [Candidatus Sulfotelmatobacter sp. SbA7]
MRGIALDPGRTAVFNGDQDAAGVGAIVGTGGVDDLLHCFDYTGTGALRPGARNKKLPPPQAVKVSAVSASKAERNENRFISRSCFGRSLLGELQVAALDDSTLSGLKSFVILIQVCCGNRRTGSWFQKPGRDVASYVSTIRLRVRHKLRMPKPIES